MAWAEARFVWPDVFILIIEDHVVGDIPADGGDIASHREALARSRVCEYARARAVSSAMSGL